MKTAVQWLFEAYRKEEIVKDHILELFKKAEEMEYWQQKYAFDKGFYYGRCTDLDKKETFEYFINNFKSEE
jgi:hypothetical protein